MFPAFSDSRECKLLKVSKKDFTDFSFQCPAMLRCVWSLNCQLLSTETPGSAWRAKQRGIHWGCKFYFVKSGGRIKQEKALPFKIRSCWVFSDTISGERVWLNLPSGPVADHHVTPHQEDDPGRWRWSEVNQSPVMPWHTFLLIFMFYCDNLVEHFCSDAISNTCPDASLSAHRWIVCVLRLAFRTLESHTVSVLKHNSI